MTANLQKAIDMGKMREFQSHIIVYSGNGEEVCVQLWWCSGNSDLVIGSYFEANGDRIAGPWYT